uniref:Uncharacterized protein n=1 Tax=Hyaloperonospora arabidopsidis (strain Emoy2) TaxID=559515 RepID=M4C4X5_HYAAE
MNDFHGTLARIDQQTQRLEVDLVRVVATLIETPRPHLDASLRQSIRRAESLADLTTLENDNIVEPTDHLDLIARLCVAIAQFEQASAACRQIAEARAQQASVHGVTTAYQVQLMEATMALWTGGDNALHAARQTIEDQRRSPPATASLNPLSLVDSVDTRHQQRDEFDPTLARHFVEFGGVDEFQD